MALCIWLQLSYQFQALPHAMCGSTRIAFVSPKMPQIAVLAHHQEAKSHRDTFVPRDIADLLVERMVAERLSQGLIRMFPPDSIFPVQKFVTLPLPWDGKLPPRDVPGVYFQEPQSVRWQIEHRTVVFARP